MFTLMINDNKNCNDEEHLEIKLNSIIVIFYLMIDYIKWCIDKYIYAIIKYGYGV
jgi:hypothetical protein